MPKSLSGINGFARCTSGWLRKSHQEAETKYGRDKVYVKESMYKQMYKGKRKSQPEAEQEALKAWRLARQQRQAYPPTFAHHVWHRHSSDKKAVSQTSQEFYDKQLLGLKNWRIAQT